MGEVTEHPADVNERVLAIGLERWSDNALLRVDARLESRGVWCSGAYSLALGRSDEKHCWIGHAIDHKGDAFQVGVVLRELGVPMSSRTGDLRVSGHGQALAFDGMVSAIGLDDTLARCRALVDAEKSRRGL